MPSANPYCCSDTRKYQRAYQMLKKEPGLTKTQVEERVEEQERFICLPANVKRRYRQMLSEAKSRAKRDELPFQLTLSDIFDNFSEGDKCPVLGIKMYFNHGGKSGAPNSPSLDKLIPVLGYTTRNIRIISWRANKIKTNATLDEVERLVVWMRREQDVLDSIHTEVDQFESKQQVRFRKMHMSIIEANHISITEHFKTFFCGFYGYLLEEFDTQWQTQPNQHLFFQLYRMQERERAIS